MRAIDIQTQKTKKNLDKEKKGVCPTGLHIP